MTLAVRLLALATLLGCSDLTDAEAGVVAIEVTVPFPATVTVGDSIQLSARALNKDGDAVPVAISWATPDTAIITVDPTTGIVTGVAAGSGRVQALSGSLSSALVTVTVEAPTTEALRRVR